MVQKVGEYQKIFGNASAVKFVPFEDLDNTFGFKLLQMRNNFGITGNLKERRCTQ
jgi:hypothetical protein